MSRNETTTDLIHISLPAECEINLCHINISQLTGGLIQTGVWIHRVGDPTGTPTAHRDRQRNGTHTAALAKNKLDQNICFLPSVLVAVTVYDQ